MVQPLQPYVTAGKTIALMNLGRWSNASAFQHTVYVCHCFPAKKQSSSDVTIQWFWSPRRGNLTTFNFFPFYLPCSNGARCHDLRFLIFSLKPALSFSFTLIKRLFSSSLLSAVRVVSSAYLLLLIFSPPVLILACDSSSLAFHMMYFSSELNNKQGDNIQPWFIPSPVLNQSQFLLNFEFFNIYVCMDS